MLARAMSKSDRRDDKKSIETGLSRGDLRLHCIAARTVDRQEGRSSLADFLGYDLDPVTLPAGCVQCFGTPATARRTSSPDHVPLRGEETTGSKQCFAFPGTYAYWPAALASAASVQPCSTGSSGGPAARMIVAAEHVHHRCFHSSIGRSR
jgi:hypothetical protein